MKLRFSRLSAAAIPPTRAHPGDAGFDLHAAEGASLAAGARASVGTALALEIPEGWAGLVLPRSGLAANHGITLTNAPGLIDAGYRGEIRVLLLNTDATETFEIKPGDRIAQLMLVRHSVPDLDEVDALEESVRGGDGFGSTGS